MSRFSDLSDIEKLALFDAVVYSSKEMVWSPEEGEAIDLLRNELREEVKTND